MFCTQGYLLNFLRHGKNVSDSFRIMFLKCVNQMAFQRNPFDDGVLADLMSFTHITGVLGNDQMRGPSIQVGSNTKGRNAHFKLYEGLKAVLSKHPDGCTWLGHFTEKNGDRNGRSHAGKFLLKEKYLKLMVGLFIKICVPIKFRIPDQNVSFS